MLVRLPSALLLPRCHVRPVLEGVVRIGGPVFVIKPLLKKAILCPRMSHPHARLHRRKKGAIMKIAYAIITAESVFADMVSHVVVSEDQDPTDHPCFFGKVVDVETIGYVS